ncbi:hypothetical protein C8A05DRAFT_18552 [Staphylotrichum tortipilum]|uniref:ABM domain-containing protein n=1 Tax=Staphylotrichum tortipilum TaxID=2831512 RepID=A0AAN6MDL5_9PEZI|nr:hypothetical protein C8A05DRAFT_18552 [Staphylotrichum longicolle]
MVTTTSPAFVFQTLSPVQQPTATVLDEIRRREGFRRALFGVKMEDPETGVLCTEWSTPSAALSYSHPPQPSTTASALVFTTAVADAGEWHRALSAPCTEVFTAYGAEEEFEGNVARFVAEVRGRMPTGAEGAAFGVATGDGTGKEEGGTVRMVIGWESRERHVEEKGKEDAIHQNIHELRTLRRAVDLFHVAFKEV